VYFITQFPTLYDHHGRRLVGRHVHLIRRKGAPFASLYDSDTVISDPNDRKQLRGLEKKTYRYPNAVFDLYHSAEVHTHKFRPPRKLWVLIFVFLAVVGLGGYTYVFMTEDFGKGQAGEGGKSESAAPGLPSSSDLLPPVEKRSLDYDDFKPTVPDIPATAPIYREALKVQSVPFVTGCAQVITSEWEICRCHSDQGAILPVSIDFCRYYVKNGYHNFLRKTDSRF
jgi:zona occludens toxin